MATALCGATCSAPGCSEPGTNKCSSCKSTPYCGVACQTKDWPRHKEECQGHLRKLGVAHLEKAKVFDETHNWVQSLRWSDMALSKLKKLTARPRTLEIIQILDDALRYKFNALNCTNLKSEALECAEERYSLWAAGHMRNPLMLEAAFPLIEGLCHTRDFQQAILIARTAYDMIINDTDNMIPADHHPFLLAQASEYLAQAIFGMAQSGGIPQKEKQKAGEEAIALARKALELHTELQGADSYQVAKCSNTLADVLDHFNNVDDDEILRLYRQVITIYSHVHGTTSPNVAVGTSNLAEAYNERAKRAHKADDLQRHVDNLVLAMPHYRESVRIYRLNNRTEMANRYEGVANRIEANIPHVRFALAMRVAEASTKR